MKDMPVIDETKCGHCGLCVSVCACGALKIVGSSVRAVKVDECRCHRRRPSLKRGPVPPPTVTPMFLSRLFFIIS